MTQLSEEQQKASNDAEGVFVFRHAADCAWERTTSAQCEYRNTHHYCPHSEHACTCPEISGELSDNPTLEEAEAYLRAQGIDPEDVANDFIERLLRQNLELKQQLARFDPRICVKCGHEERFSDNEGGFCEKIVLAPSVAGSGLAKCGCCCQFPALPARLSPISEQEGIVNEAEKKGATAMRDKCVEKVREYLTDCRDEERGIIEAIAAELSSLTLDQVKPGDM